MWGYLAIIIKPHRNVVPVVSVPATKRFITLVSRFSSWKYESFLPDFWQMQKPCLLFLFYKKSIQHLNIAASKSIMAPSLRGSKKKMQGGPCRSTLKHYTMLRGLNMPRNFKKRTILRNIIGPENWKSLATYSHPTPAFHTSSLCFRMRKESINPLLSWGFRVSSRSDINLFISALFFRAFLRTILLLVRNGPNHGKMLKS